MTFLFFLGEYFLERLFFGIELCDEIVLILVELLGLSVEVSDNDR